MDYKKYLGDWINTLQQDPAITRFKLFEEQGAVMIEAETAGPIKNLGKAPTQMFVLASDPEKVTAFEVRYDTDATEYHMCINDSKGLLVAATFQHVKDGSNRKPIFSREFFYKD